MTPSRIRILILLLATFYGLVAARGLHGWFQTASREYYLSLSPRLGMDPSSSVLFNCDVATCIAELAQMAPPEGVLGVGACDLFMYNGGVAASGFLAFLTLFFAFLVGTLALQGVCPPSWRRNVLLAMSLLFLAVALPLRPALWIVEGALAVVLVAQLPLAGRWRAGLLLGLGVVLLATGGRELLSALGDGFFRLSRLGPEIWAPQPGSLAFDGMVFMRLGVVGSTASDLDGFPFALLGLALLLKAFRRILRLAWELGTGRLDTVGTRDGLLYLLGLPALLGNSATPSFSEFVQSWDREPGPAVGAATVAFCLGLVPILYVILVMMGYSPAVRVLFPTCDLAAVGAAEVWLRLATVYVIEYLFLLATEQASVGAARLLGYGLRDNYAAPLTARGLPDFWRRWNIYWREFLVEVFFWPTALALARRTGEIRGWHVPVAAGATFLGTFLLNVLPLLLLGGAASALVPSLAVYYALEGALVAGGLVAEQRRGRALLPPALAIAATFAVVALLRAFLVSGMSLEQQLRMVEKALLLGFHGSG